MSTIFKKGDLVECTDSYPFGGDLTRGRVYAVASINHNTRERDGFHLRIKSDKNRYVYFLPHRFKKLEV